MMLREVPRSCRIVNSTLFKDMTPSISSISPRGGCCLGCISVDLKTKTERLSKQTLQDCADTEVSGATKWTLVTQDVEKAELLDAFFTSALTSNTSLQQSQHLESRVKSGARNT